MTPTMSGANRGAEDREEKAWFHFWFSTYGTWLRGDERGFRDHDHRVHSSGDYRNPPPKDEHAGLRAWTRAHMHKDPVRLDAELRRRVCASIVTRLRTGGVELLVVAVMNDHVHGLAWCPVESVKTLVGHAKRSSSHAIRDRIPGAAWGRRCGLKRIKDQEHQRATFCYIAGHGRKGGVVWTFRDPDPRVGS